MFDKPTKQFKEKVNNCLTKAKVFDIIITACYFCNIKYSCGNSSVDRALPCQGRGHGFEPRFPLQILKTSNYVGSLFCTVNKKL